MTDAIVLVPGLQSDASSWKPLVDRLSLHHPLCLPRGHQFQPDIGAMAASVLHQAPERFHLMGWSMGGYIAFEILRRAPDRLASLALISTTAAPENPDSLPRREEALALARETGLAGYQTANMGQCLYDPTGVDPAHIASLVDASEGLGFDALEIQTRAIIARPDSRPDLAACPVPTLILAGREDRIIPVEHAREMHRLLPSATYHELEHCGHCPPLEKPDQVAAILGNWIHALQS